MCIVLFLFVEDLSVRSGMVEVLGYDELSFGSQFRMSMNGNRSCLLCSELLAEERVELRLTGWIIKKVLE